MTNARYTIGNLTVDVLSDGYFLQDAGGIFGLIPRTMWEAQGIAPNERNLIRVDLNCLLVRGDGHTTLIDTGVGTKIPAERRDRVYPGDYGYLLGRLNALGVQAADIDVVVNTHLHFDHCGWNTLEQDGKLQPAFPNAQYYMQRREYEDATHPNERTRTTYLADNFVPLVDSGRLNLVDGEHQMTAALRYLPTPGHTDGHAAVVLSSGGETGVYIGDIVQHSLQLERTPWVSAFDILPLVSMETKKKFVADAMASGALIFSPHIAYPGAGHMREENGRMRFVPA